MARKKKMFNYEFADCKQALPSSVTVKCSKSGETVKMYHKQLVKLIIKKYNNNWSLFQSSYVKKGNNVDSDVDNEDEFNIRPEGYKRYLIVAYNYAKRDTRLSPSDLAAKLEFLDKCYYNRWGSSLEEAARESA